MENNIKTILEDLYSIDPRFKKHETELSSFVLTFLNSRPDAYMDPSFTHRLRADLIESMSPSLEKPRKILSPYRFFTSPTEFRSSVLVAIIAVLVVAPITYVATEKTLGPTDIKNITANLTQEQQITLKPGNAFGTIALAKTTPVAKASDTVRNSKTTSENPIAMSMMSGTSTADVSAVTAISLEQAFNPEYVYAGKPISIDKEGSVLKRTIGNEASKALLEVFKNLNFDLANLSSFTGLSVQTIRLSENKPLGYTITVDMNSGAISIEQDSTQWPAEAQEATATSTLSSTEAVTNAATFLKDHGIKTKNYGSPRVVASLSTKEQTTVVFPLVVDKHEVYNEDTTPYGITVVIDTRSKKVVSVTNIISQLFDSSKYPFQTDPLKVLSSINATSSATTIPELISLDEPKLIFVHTFQTDTATSSELFVPALYFRTATSSPKGTPKALIAPLVKDLSESSAISTSTTRG